MLVHFREAVVFDDIDIFPATRLLDKRREILDLTVGLNQEKEAFRMRMEIIAQRREEFKRKAGLFEETINRFEMFLEENDAKRNRAIKKAHEERKLRESKIGEIDKLKETLTILGKQKQQQELALEHGQKYLRYLESIFEISDGFSEIKDVLSRFDALSEANHELQKRAKEVQELQEALKLKYQMTMENHHTLILNNNNLMAQTKEKNEDAKQKAKKWQSVLETSIHTTTQQGLEVGQIQLATSNLFQLVKSHLNNRISGTTDTFVQLDKIQQFILDLTEIVKQGVSK
ncbi:Cilia- and flagella-associated protein 73 [Coelomomyces lativittatus]|nr:Cilia- and flagella-associated protein 73 [Coelomomyces lativittatus]